MQQDYLLVRKMQNGDEEAMDLFVREYYPQILKYCRYHCPDKEAAQDLTQETFARFFKNLSSYRYRGKTLNYLYTIARNLCIDLGRKMRENAAGDQPESWGRTAADAGAPGSCVSVGGADAEGGTCGIEERILVEEALKKLPVELYEVVVLHYFQELSLREAAAVLQIGLPLVKYRIGKARERLRELL